MYVIVRGSSFFIKIKNHGNVSVTYSSKYDILIKILFAGGVETMMTSLTAASLLVFSLLYTPCVAAIASIKRELGTKWAAGVVIWQCVIAWLCSLAVYLIGKAIGM